VRALGVLALLLLALLPGCAEDRRAILVWHSYRGDSEKALEELAAHYEREKGVHVELLGIPFDAFASKLESAVPHQHGPDVFIDAHERLGSYRKNGIVAPAGDAFVDADRARFDASVVRALEADGQVWGVPLESKCLALYLSNTLVPNDPAALEELFSLRASLPKDAYPLAYEANNAYAHAAVLHAFGGRLLGEDGGFGMQGDAAERSLELVRGWTDERLVPEEPGPALVTQLFAGGKAAAAISGPWLAADLRDAPAWRVIPLPKLGATGQTLAPLLTVDAAFLTPDGAKKRDARDFAHWLGDTDAAVLRAKVGHQIVTDGPAWDDPDIAKDQTLAAFHAAAKDAIPMPTNVRMRALWVPAEQAIRKVMRRGATPAEALSEAAFRFDDSLRPPPPPPSPTPLLVAIGLALLVGAVLAVRRVRDPAFRGELRASLPAYKYVAHAVLVVFVLVVLPLLAGAATSLFAGTRQEPIYVGLGNYVRILTARGGPLLAQGSFYLTLMVTVLWTVVNVFFHVSIGMLLGLVLSRPVMRLKAAYRVLLILPWAVPSYVTALAWKGMFHRQFGAINAILSFLGAEPISWFSKFSTAFAANVATNVWLGFPFMMVVTMGALTSIPKEVLEAAEVDGATRWQRFRLVTFPLLRPALLPSVVLGAMWTFNMFNVVFLVSGGEPDGKTDILVSEAYRWAFTRDAQYGYAAAYAVLIFFILSIVTRVTKRLGKEAEA
jgi:arabinogalactan oligomer/maltooligosaccharide transport system permease protein